MPEAFSPIGCRKEADTLGFLTKSSGKKGFRKSLSCLPRFLSALTLKASSRSTVVGWWALEKPCAASDGVEMQEDSWHDDRMDLDLSTRCFAAAA